MVDWFWVQQQKISNIIRRKQDLQWLIDLAVQPKKVVHFGCDKGEGTLALIWVLDADEAAGIDISQQAISQAHASLTDLRDVLREIQSSSHSLPREVQDWWTSVPVYFKAKLLSEKLCVTFDNKDITKPTGLPTSYYDLAFCRYVLHHVWCDAGMEHGKNDALFAVREMARVVRPGGLIAVDELIQYSDGPILDFPSLFEKAGLKLLYKKEEESTIMGVHSRSSKYLCKKTEAEIR